MKKPQPKIKRFNQKKFLKDLWKLWSIYIRSKDADFRGYIKCFTCPFTAHWKSLQAGHYWHGVLDFEPKNIHPQCQRCNKWLHGNLQNYSLALIAKYGSGILDELLELKKQARLNPKPDIAKLKLLHEQLKEYKPK